MSVIVTIRVSGDPKRVEEYASANPDTMQKIVERAKGRGLIAHRFYGSDDGHILVADEWPDQASFQTFFDESSSEIGAMFQTAGVTSDPEFGFWRKLETGDDYGWG